jgi:hypothetical protein
LRKEGAEPQVGSQLVAEIDLPLFGLAPKAPDRGIDA